MTDAIIRAKRAKAIVEDAVFTDALSEIERHYHDEFRNSAPHDSAAREFAYAKLRALDDLRAQFRIIIDAGTLLDKRGR